MAKIFYKDELIAQFKDREDAQGFLEWKRGKLLSAANDGILDRIAREEHLDRRYPGLFPQSIVSSYYDEARQQIEADCRMEDESLELSEEMAVQEKPGNIPAEAESLTEAETPDEEKGSLLEWLLEHDMDVNEVYRMLRKIRDADESVVLAYAEESYYGDWDSVHESQVRRDELEEQYNSMVPAHLRWDNLSYAQEKECQDWVMVQEGLLPDPPEAITTQEELDAFPAEQRFNYSPDDDPPKIRIAFGTKESPAELKKTYESAGFNYGFYIAGDHCAVVRGSTEIGVRDNAMAVAHDESRLRARDNSKVEAFDNSGISAYENSVVEAWGNSVVEAWGNSVVKAHDNSVVKAYGNSRVEAYGGHCEVELHDAASVRYIGRFQRLKKGIQPKGPKL